MPDQVTNDISFCKGCGNCTIGNFKEMAKTYNVKIAVATGGTIARMIVLKTRPKFILAVACHQDLVNGLLESFPILIYGVLNEAPFGPCMNTTVDVCKIDNILNQFVRSV